MGAPEATTMMRADNRKLRGDLSKSKRLFNRAFSKIGKGIRSKLAGGLKALSGIGAGVGLVAIGKDVLDFEEKLVRLGIQAGKSGKPMDQLRVDLIQLSKATGISRGELIGAAEALVNLTGPAGLSIEKVEALSKASLATGTSMKDLAELSFSLDRSFGLANADELLAGLGAITEAGKSGAIPLNEMAQVLQKVGGTFAKTSSAGVEGAAELSAALQVLRDRGFASAAEAGTGLEAVITELAQKSSQLEDKGINVFDPDTGAQRKTLQVLREIDQANLTDKEIAGIFVGKEARKSLDAFFKDSFKSFDTLKAKALAAGKVIKRDAKTFEESTAGRLKKATNALKENIAKIFTPERIEKFVQAMGKVADAAGFIVDHIKEFALIFAGIKLASFAVTMASVAASMTAAGVGGAALALGIGRASALAAAFVGGFAIGTYLDNLIGASDKISDFLDKKLGPTKEFEDTGFFRDRAADIGGLVGRGRLSGGNQKAFQDLGGGRDVEGSLRAAKQTLRGARESEVLNQGGRIDPVQAARVTGTDFEAGFAKIGRFEERAREGKIISDAQGALIENIKAAQRLIAQSEKVRARGFEVRITVDQEGRIIAVGDERSQGAE